MNYRQSVNIAAVFLLLIFGFAIATVLKPSNERSETENRLLEQKPDLTWNALISGEFSEDYEAYLSDQFVGRDGWISLKTAFRLLSGPPSGRRRRTSILPGTII